MHAIAFGHIIVVAQHIHVHDITTAIDKQWQSAGRQRAQNSTTKVSFCTINMFELVHNSNHDGVVRIFIRFSCELCFSFII